LLFLRWFQDLVKGQLSLATAASTTSGEGNIAYLERAQQALVYAHHRSSIVEFSAVIGRAEQRDQLSFREEFVAIFNNLVCSTDQVHIVLGQESGDDVGTEGEGDTTIVFAPASDVLVGIRPQQIAK
jgi:hypothetical protein